MVTWFAGLFYIVRLFIYHREANDQTEPELSILTRQFSIMERRLWYAITWPSAVLCTLMGVIMLVMDPVLLHISYMQLKLGFIVALLIYQFATHKLFRQFQGPTAILPSSIRLRFFNEFPTVILIAVIFIIIKKDSFSWISGLIGILGVAILLSVAIKWYQRLRK